MLMIKNNDLNNHEHDGDDDDGDDDDDDDDDGDDDDGDDDEDLMYGPVQGSDQPQAFLAKPIHL